MLTDTRVDKLASQIIAEMTPNALSAAKHYKRLRAQQPWPPDYGNLRHALKTSETFWSVELLCSAYEVSRVEVAVLEKLEV